MINQEVLIKRLSIVLYENFVLSDIMFFMNNHKKGNLSLYDYTLERLSFFMVRFNSRGSFWKATISQCEEGYEDSFSYSRVEPCFVEMKENITNGEFILGGVFVDACNKQVLLTKEVIDGISIDCINRIYTLIKFGRIKIA